MWISLAYLCSRCRTFTSLDLRAAYGAACAGCGEPLPLEGRAQVVPERELNGVIARSPVPVLLLYWNGAPGGQGQSWLQVESLARAMSGELAVVVLDVAGDPGAADDQRARGAPSAVIMVRGKEVGRGLSVPSELEVRAVLRRAAPAAARSHRREVRA